MKNSVLILTCILLTVFNYSAFAQKAMVNKPTVSTLKSPDFEVGSGIKEPKGERKDWLQIEVAFRLDSASRDDFIEAVEVKFFVLPKSAQPKYKKLYTAVVNHVDLPKGETLRSSVFLSPNSLARIYGKGKKPNPRDLMVAVELHSGQIIGGEVTDGKSSRWWQKSDAPTDSSMLRPKSKTPFAYLWFDSYAETRD
ncbi:MAG TPA: hypothetical protein EYG40_09335 [Verrucomicrobia bacterium]|nr:hypothetical protein [Verrucomicrobiales bacterium]HIL55225.1 hypothetical protein [Verrucomicrobiota bacterium]